METENETIAWHSRTVQQVAEALETELETGLTADKARTHLAQYGTNELAERPRPGFWQ
jgi:magnesium-transporting ATPase (P-type)